MGKIRIKALGDEIQEKKQKQELKKKRDEKKTAKAPGLHGGERVVAVGPSEEEIAKLEELEKPAITEKKQKKTGVTKKARERSKRYKSAKIQIDRNKFYPLKEALEILPKIAANKFDETVELHLNTIEKGIFGNLSLPYGTGKKTRVAVANEQIIAEVEKGKINFDVLVASPEIMPKLAKVARILGPKGLMPNPKAGTITKTPEDLIKKFESGQINYKTEAKAPIIHLSVGKISFGKEKLSNNIQTVIKSVQPSRIKKAILKSTMSPSIKIQL